MLFTLKIININYIKRTGKNFDSTWEWDYEIVMREKKGINKKSERREFEKFKREYNKMETSGTSQTLQTM